MLYFAYGSNMHPDVMRKHAPGAEPVGPAMLADHRLVITGDGYASVEPGRNDQVHGVLWRLTARDRVTLDAWENVAGGLYRAATLPVRCGGQRRLALVYLARPGRAGQPRAGYMEVVIAAALEWRLPPAYIVFLRHWLPKRPGSADLRKVRVFRWT